MRSLETIATPIFAVPGKSHYGFWDHNLEIRISSKD
jgi:hypothetical protein